MAQESLLEPIVTVPGGVALEDGRRLSRAELRPLSGREEEWLARHPGTPSALCVTQLLSACLVRLEDLPTGRDLVRRMLVGDRDYLMLQLRRLTLGDTFQAVLVCPACGSRMDVEFQAADVPVEGRPQETAAYTLEMESSPSTRRAVVFRLPTGADQEAVLGLDLEAATQALLDRCLVDGRAASLSSEEQGDVIDAMDDLAPQINLELELTCPECGHEFVAPFDTTAFFLSEMRSQATQLLREVHHLAFHYHWGEGEILNLTRPRRRAYLALLAEALREE